MKAFATLSERIIVAAMASIVGSAPALSATFVSNWVEIVSFD